MENYQQAIFDFGDKAHGEQMRKYSPDRYMVHPRRVMETCQLYTQDRAVLAAALLHDVLEDTTTTKEEIEQFLISQLSLPETKKAIQLVLELTDVYVKEAYPEWNRKKRRAMEFERLAKVSAEAQTIKYADLIDNCQDIAANDPEFAKLFLRESAELLKVMEKGNKELRERAMKVIEQIRKTVE